MKLEVGTKVFYTLNESWGEITAIYQDGKNESVDILMEYGRFFKGLSIAHFKTEKTGIRFMTLEEYEAKKRAEQEILEKRMRDLGIRK